jgi:hypothetical protein
LDAGALGGRWSDLVSEDAAVAGAAVHALVGSPEEAVPFLKSRVRPVSPVDPAVVAGLLEKLNGNAFRDRVKAQADLIAIGDHVVPYLNKALAGNVPLEARSRLEALHAKVTAIPISGERLRLARSVEVLERIGSPGARRVLWTLAGGAPGALATTHAREALRRLPE